MKIWTSLKVTESHIPTWLGTSLLPLFHQLLDFPFHFHIIRMFLYIYFLLYLHIHTYAYELSTCFVIFFFYILVYANVYMYLPFASKINKNAQNSLFVINWNFTQTGGQAHCQHVRMHTYICMSLYHHAAMSTLLTNSVKSTYTTKVC